MIRFELDRSCSIFNAVGLCYLSENPKKGVNFMGIIHTYIELAFASWRWRWIERIYPDRITLPLLCKTSQCDHTQRIEYRVSKLALVN